MKRKQLPVTLSHVDGRSFILGHVSRCTSSCFAAFMVRDGWNRAFIHGLRDMTFKYERGAPEGFYRVRAVAGNWTLEILEAK